MVFLDNCKKFGLVFDNVVGIVEVINSKDIQMQVSWPFLSFSRFCVFREKVSKWGEGQRERESEADTTLNRSLKRGLNLRTLRS